MSDSGLSAVCKVCYVTVFFVFLLLCVCVCVGHLLAVFSIADAVEHCARLKPFQALRDKEQRSVCFDIYLEQMINSVLCF